MASVKHRTAGRGRQIDLFKPDSEALRAYTEYVNKLDLDALRTEHADNKATGRTDFAEISQRRLDEWLGEIKARQAQLALPVDGREDVPAGLADADAEHAPHVG
jgi:hypothetical protein